MSMSEKERLEVLEWVKDQQTFNRLEYFEPYPKQMEFFAQGATKKERLLMAGNQLGKSEAGAFETACHLTGLYPTWWPGRRFDKPTRAWAAGETGIVTRDVSQKKLCGEPGVEAALGTGYIPKRLFVDKPSLSRSATDAFDTIQVRHVTGGVSILRFKSYEQGRTKFQAETLDFGWGDEECPPEVYSEFFTRFTATDGMLFQTFTPLKGRTAVVNRFLDEENEDRGHVIMTIDDVTHITPKQKAKIIAAYPPHEREARVKGIPFMGSGRVFTSTEESISEPAITHVPPHWTKLWGIDFGIGHPFGAVLLLWDRDNDVIHVHHAIRVADQSPLQQAVPMKLVGANVPVAWPQDGTQREKGTGETVASHYRRQGLLMLSDHATWPDGGVSTEAGILEMEDRMVTGRLKVAAHLTQWFEEYRLFHRKDGVLVKVKDDLLSATRIGIMMKRFSRAVALGSKKAERKSNGLARGLDFDYF